MARCWRRTGSGCSAPACSPSSCFSGSSDRTCRWATRRPSAPARAWARPSAQFLFGTDELGRDYLPRVVEGIGATFLLSSIAVVITAVIGTFLGIAAGYLGGFVDSVIARCADVLFAFPALLFGLLAAAVIGPGNTSAIVVISTATLPLFIRVIRSVSLAVAEREFVVSSVIAGASTLRVMGVHILPNILGAAIVQLTYALSIGMLIESGLSFLGLGVQPPNASLGSLLRLGSVYLTVAPWLVLIPGVVLALAIAVGESARRLRFATGSSRCAEGR